MVIFNKKIGKNEIKTDTFGQRLCKSRKSKGLSQKKLADFLDYKQHVSISNLESDSASPDIVALQKLAKILEVDLHWLITGENFNPQKRIQAQFTETYSNLMNEYQQAQDAVQRLEAKKQSGQPLTAAEERELLTCRGRARVAVRYMENAMQAASKEMNTPGGDNKK